MLKKLTERSAKYIVMKTGMSQYVIINCQEIFVSNTRHLITKYFCQIPDKY